MSVQLYISAFIAVVITSFAIFFLAYINEKRIFNNGICPYCKTKLKYFDTDSQGSRGYICNNCGYNAWIVFSFDKKNKHKNIKH